VHDAAYGGNSLLANGLTPTGPMPTLRARMIAFQSGGNANCELIGEKKFSGLPVVRCGNDLSQS
jgi:hypothetical protein